MGSPENKTPFAEKKDSAPGNMKASQPRITLCRQLARTPSMNSRERFPSGRSWRFCMQTLFSGTLTERPEETDVLVHRVNTGDAQHRRCNLRPLSKHKRVVVDTTLGEMIDTGAVPRSKQVHERALVDTNLD
ncbi:hypothetical protein HPB51_028466 [Rhipicephalus microplus]|uniref:Uncharacterized protein n=1 Tax=Rhipicephalus microplus TaxID=6941 RepID=A0A9J6CX90_RHIMP|nr:hypothetical protein HPB51_028466 [Rhipicephalus microplus]